MVFVEPEIEKIVEKTSLPCLIGFLFLQMYLFIVGLFSLKMSIRSRVSFKQICLHIKFGQLSAIETIHKVLNTYDVQFNL